MIDASSEFGARAERRLGEEKIGWLTTVRRDGTPQPSPIWFLWNGESALVYSQPGTQKLRNIARNPHVSLHLDGDGSGGDIVIITGEAHVADHEPPANEVPEYVTKYEAGMEGIGMTPAEFARSYSVPLRVRAVGVRGH